MRINSGVIYKNYKVFNHKYKYKKRTGYVRYYCFFVEFLSKITQ